MPLKSSGRASLSLHPRARQLAAGGARARLDVDFLPLLLAWASTGAVYVAAAARLGENGRPERCRSYCCRSLLRRVPALRRRGRLASDDTLGAGGGGCFSRRRVPASSPPAPSPLIPHSQPRLGGYGDASA